METSRKGPVRVDVEEERLTPRKSRLKEYWQSGELSKKLNKWDSVQWLSSS